MMIVPAQVLAFDYGAAVLAGSQSPFELPAAFRSIRTKLAVLVLLGMVAAALVVGTLMGRAAFNLIGQQAIIQIDRQNLAITQAVDGLAKTAEDAMLMAGHDSVFSRYFSSAGGGNRGDDRLLPEMQDKLKLLHTMFEIDEACVIDAAGAEHARAVDGQLAIATELSSDESDHPFFAATLKMPPGHVYHSSVPYQSEDTGEWALAYATPIFAGTDKPAGMLHFEVPFQWFVDTLNAASRGGSYSFMISTDGHLLVPPRDVDPDAPLPKIQTKAHATSFKQVADYDNASLRQLIERMLLQRNGRGSFLDRSGDPQEVIFRATYGGEWLVATAIPRSIVEAPSHRLLGSTILTATPVMLLALATMVWFAGRMIGPLRKMTEQMNAIARGHVAQELPRLAQDELGNMSSAMGEMIAYHREMTLAAESIADGDFSKTVVPRSPHDGLGNAFVRMSAELRALLATIRSAEARFRALVQNANDAIVLLDQNGIIQFASPAILDITGNVSELVLNRSFAELLHEDDCVLFRSVLNKNAETSDDESFVELRVRHQDGSLRFSEVVLNNKMHDQSVRAIIATCHDVTERKAFEDQLTDMAFRDTLTGLPNRALFRDRLENAIARSQRDRHQLAVIYIDLDNFKVVNDSLGHESGDALLKEVAQRLQTCVRESDTLARLGGDEFVVLLDPCESPEVANMVAERMIATLKGQIKLDRHNFVTLASMGIAINTESGIQASDMLRNADTAMYCAKAGGKGHYVIFDPKMNDSANERLRMEGDLRMALERGELDIHYQPIVDLQNDSVREVEALLRWHHPDLGPISPGKFVPVAEESGLIVPIGNWVLRESCRQLRAWQLECGRADLSLSVNLSTRQFQHPNLVEDVRNALREFSLEPQCLKLEITESMMMRDTEQAVSVLKRLKEVGVKLAIDDFGTGYSSMSYLKKLPIDVLKIDRAFVNGLQQSGQDSAIVRSIIELAQALNLRVTAEGIETPTQANELKSLNCHYGQGYHYSKPVPSTAISNLLKQAPVDNGEQPAPQARVAFG